MFLEVLSSIVYKNNILGWCINTFSDRVEQMVLPFYCQNFEYLQYILFNPNQLPVMILKWYLKKTSTSLPAWISQCLRSRQLPFSDIMIVLPVFVLYSLGASDELGSAYHNFIGIRWFRFTVRLPIILKLPVTHWNIFML